MTVEVAGEALSATGSPMLARPVAFDGLFGWLHPGTTRRGVLLCGTLGFEQLSAYRAWRALAEEIAAAGCPCLRFDYPGEGDSGEDGAGRVLGFVKSVRRAMRYLREEADVEEIVLVGLRLGGMLAVLAAREGGVDRLILLAPFGSGRAYLREMQLQARTTVIWPGGVPLQSKPGTLNVHGFVLKYELIDDIKNIDNKIYEEINVPDVLVIEQTTSKSLSLSTLFETSVRKEIFLRFNELLSGEMNFRSVSEVVIAFKGLNTTITNFSISGVRAENANICDVHPEDRLIGCGWDEEPTFFGNGLFGIICKPNRVSVEKCCVLFVNSGTYVRSGSGRYTTRLARELAIRGIVSFRIDLRGSGDSSDCPKKHLPLYNLETFNDVKLAIDRLQSSNNAPVILIGFCSGAYLGFHAACKDERISDAFLTNLYCFDWPSNVRLESVLGRPTVRSAASYAKSLLNSNTWRRIISGNVSIFSIFLSLSRFWSKALFKRWSALWSLRIAGSSVIDRVAKVRRRGGRLTLIYSADDPGILNIQAELGLSLANIKRTLGCRLEIIEQCDHNFSTLESQIQMKSMLIEIIDHRIDQVRIA